MTIVEKIMFTGIILGLGICGYSIWLANRYMVACDAIDSKLIQYEQAERIIKI
jgi:hypothetical protein